MSKKKRPDAALLLDPHAVCARGDRADASAAGSECRGHRHGIATPPACARRPRSRIGRRYRDRWAGRRCADRGFDFVQGQFHRTFVYRELTSLEYSAGRRGYPWPGFLVGLLGGILVHMAIDGTLGCLGDESSPSGCDEAEDRAVVTGLIAGVLGAGAGTLIKRERWCTFHLATWRSGSVRFLRRSRVCKSAAARWWARVSCSGCPAAAGRRFPMQWPHKTAILVVASLLVTVSNPLSAQTVGERVRVSLADTTVVGRVTAVSDDGFELVQGQNSVVLRIRGGQLAGGE